MKPIDALPELLRNMGEDIQKANRAMEEGLSGLRSSRRPSIDTLMNRITDALGSNYDGLFFDQITGQVVTTTPVGSLTEIRTIVRGLGIDQRLGLHLVDHTYRNTGVSGLFGKSQREFLLFMIAQPSALAAFQTRVTVAPNWANPHRWLEERVIENQALIIPPTIIEGDLPSTVHSRFATKVRGAGLL